MFNSEWVRGLFGRKRKSSNELKRPEQQEKKRKKRETRLQRHRRILSSRKINRSAKEQEERIMKGRGLSRFDYRRGYVWALNQKNADRKAQKLMLV